VDLFFFWDTFWRILKLLLFITYKSEGRCSTPDGIIGIFH